MEEVPVSGLNWSSFRLLYVDFSPGLVSSVAAAVRLTAAEVRSQRNEVFSREQTRQRALYPRIEKIEVSLQGPGLDGTLLIMNKGMSTPLSCARRELDLTHEREKTLLEI